MTINTLFDGIVIFVEVVKQGSFAATAQALGHSNSHISKEINKLEARLGVRLLHRTTRSISTTPEAMPILMNVYNSLMMQSRRLI
ncbi:helix-turn-helix domain-containing protein [Shewanella marina]|uniref:helix-turn-helix domain-containing protein n=1 Tax=Shewanella marina TaxID=487319 RepID=UPI000A3EBC73|nr:LysR family transcriptional regulator [Shewanella marina]